MTFLFGMFFPSYHAYANGSKHIEFENKIMFNDDLVDKLSVSKTFEKFYNKAFILSITLSANLAVNTEGQNEAIKLKLVEINDKKTFTEAGNLEAYKILGFENIPEIKIFDSKLNELKIKLQREFPELVIMNKDELNRTLKSAIEKGGLESKAITLLTRDECYANAGNLYSDCLTQPSWFLKVVKRCAIVCFVGAIACAILGTAGTASAVIAAGCGTLFGICFTGCGAAFGLGISNISGECTDQYNARQTACINQFGVETGGGAE